MSDTAIDIDFADGHYRFALSLEQAVELERKCGPDGKPKSIFTIYEQMSQGLGGDQDGNVMFLGGGSANAFDVKETIRLGLIGGNNAIVDGQEQQVGPNRAKEICELYVYPARPLAESMIVAWSILHAAIVGVQLKKKAETPAKKSRSRSVKA